MKKLNVLTLIGTLLFSGPAMAETLIINIQNTTTEGTVRAAVYDSASAFEADKLRAGSFAPAAPGGTRLKINGLAPGTYGIAVLHDLNGNEEMDRNLFGAPNEPYGFSNNPTIGFSAPGFDEFKFDYDGTETEIQITLNGG